MQGSNLGLQTWALAIYFLTTNLKSIACTKLASDLKITQKSAWHWTGGVGGYRRQSVNHSSKEYVNGQAHTNGIESFWVLFKLGYHGTHHHMSEKFLRRYVCEFSCRHNDRKNDTINQMVSIASSMVGSQLHYKDLVV